ncbi:hypothetical protein LCGC14_1225650 [marine sediment metagenome]|uniref:Uncharacterized protein n=1 Tax=marine sediment metagenome TaxID=412755 RepID=A0A0F9PED8_9ZZZZ
MKSKLLLIGWLVVLLLSSAGCSDPYRARMQNLWKSLDYAKARGARVRQAWRQATAEEVEFISNLNNDQLVAYQTLSDIFATGNPAAEQLARRQLAQCFDGDGYAKAIVIMQDKHHARLEIDVARRSLRSLQQQGEELGRMRQRQMQAARGSMLRAWDWD